MAKKKAVKKSTSSGDPKPYEEEIENGDEETESDDEETESTEPQEAPDEGPEPVVAEPPTEVPPPPTGTSNIIIEGEGTVPVIVGGGMKRMDRGVPVEADMNVKAALQAAGVKFKEAKGK